MDLPGNAILTAQSSGDLWSWGLAGVNDLEAKAFELAYQRSQALGVVEPGLVGTRLVFFK